MDDLVVYELYNKEMRKTLKVENIGKLYCSLFVYLLINKKRPRDFCYTFWTLNLLNPSVINQFLLSSLQFCLCILM